METPSQQPPEGLDDKLVRLRELPDFRAVLEDIEARREEGFRAMKGAKSRELHQITGAMTALDEILAHYRG